ncbi:MAG: DUF2497 domain-containing protein [Hyphomicrobiales bacterium]|nr:DUF2497 domain-containing protein [Hyphomicrobiales bacterium]
MPDREQKETSGEEEILELTDIVEEDEADNAADTASDILDELDNALEEDDAMATAVCSNTANPPAASPPEEEEMTEAGEELPEMDDDTMDAAAARESLLDDQAASITSKSIKNLMHSIPKPDLNSPALRSGNTVEDLVVEAIRPMLS